MSSSVRIPTAAAPLSRTGRWAPTASQGLQASYASSSLSFHFTGPYIALEIGQGTARWGRPDGEEPMLVWAVTRPGEVEKEADVQRVRHVRPGDTVRLFDGTARGGEERRCTVYIGDWGSVIDIAAIHCSAANSIILLPPSSQPIQRILVIGDSISCAYSSGPEWGFPPRGAWDGWPLILSRLLSQRPGSGVVSVEGVAFPGVLLVDQFINGKKEEGMASRFWEKSWFDQTTWSPEQNPYNRPNTIIVALGANDDNFGVPGFHFAREMRSFLDRLSETFASTLSDLVILGPFFFVYKGSSRFTPLLAELLPQLRTAWAKDGKRKHIKLHMVPVDGWLDARTAPDTIHPSLEGNGVVARRVVELAVRGWEG